MMPFFWIAVGVIYTITGIPIIAKADDGQLSRWMEGVDEVLFVLGMAFWPLLVGAYYFQRWRHG